MIACMGGFCAKRQQCPNYTEADRTANYQERLCLRGKDGIRLVESTAFRSISIDIFDKRRKQIIKEPA